MPVLTSFLPVQELEKREVSKSKIYMAKLKKFRKSVNFLSQTFDIKVFADSDIGEQIIEKEAEVFADFWSNVGFIPKDFNCSCLGDKPDYCYLGDLSQYPIVKISELKKMADALSFVILPLDYVDIPKIVDMYAEENEDYSTNIYNAYENFQETVDICKKYTGEQQLYMLAPVSFYDPWEEVSCENLLPKYFSKGLQHLSTILGMIMPAQRNLYKMIKANEKSLQSLQTNMEENFQVIERSIAECHRRIDWVESLTKGLETKGKSSEAKMVLRLHNMQKHVTQLEHTLFCLLDPIIFSVDANIDISDTEYDDEDARIGLCFGVDMPLDFFVEKGLSLIDDESLKSVTQILKI